MSVEPTDVMPAPPNGMVWVLRLNPLSDDATLWLYKKSRITGQSNGWSVDCQGLRSPDWPRRAYMRISEASIDEIVGAAIVAGRKLVDEVKGEPGRRAAQDAKATDLSRRLGIKVEVKR